MAPQLTSRLKSEIVMQAGLQSLHLRLWHLLRPRGRISDDHMQIIFLRLTMFSILVSKRSFASPLPSVKLLNL